MPKPAEIKTKETEASVEAFINTVPDEQKRKDSFALVKLMEKATRAKAKMWGASLIGFGNKRYKSPSGREVDWFIIGFSPRKANFSLYLTVSLHSHDENLLKKLGKHKTGGGCLYINKLEDVDIKILEQMIKVAVDINSKP
jgi:hypothetical protein